MGCDALQKLPPSTMDIARRILIIANSWVPSGVPDEAYMGILPIRLLDVILPPNTQTYVRSFVDVAHLTDPS